MYKSTRFIYAMSSTLGVFLLIWFDKLPKDSYSAMFLFLSVVAGLFGTSKAIEKFKGKVSYESDR